MDWDTVQLYVQQYGYLAVTIGTIIDQSGLQSFVVAGGVVAGVSDSISIYGVIVAGAIGSFLSDVAFYGIGRWRANWLDRFVRSQKGRARLKVLEDGMNKWAFPLIVAGRLLPWIGRFVPAAAGIRKVNFARVLMYAAIGAMASSAAYAMLGYFAASTVEYMGNYSIWIWLGALVISFPVAGWIFKRFDKAVMRRLEYERKLAEEATAFGD
ncbi:MAG: VTT domain-containing protein [Planctomycetes bacterium]|nr:VTT domain-containing protein [Planctomycetota bacterium]